MAIYLQQSMGYTITDCTRHHSFSDRRVRTIKPTRKPSAAAINENTFVRHPIPRSSFETIPTSLQDQILFVYKAAVRFLERGLLHSGLCNLYNHPLQVKTNQLVAVMTQLYSFLWGILSLFLLRFVMLAYLFLFCLTF